MNDYERIARVIRYIDDERVRQPDLATLAKQAGLSPHHFHRLFTSWAAVTPKDFLQCLTLQHAKARLREGDSVLGAALESGLSGPGRLHDLCVTLEAASPGEIKAGGAGWTITAGIAESPFGRVAIGQGPRGICHLAFLDDEPARSALVAMQAEWPHATVKRDDDATARLARRIFEPQASSRSRPPLRAFVRGTEFQVRVWRALLQLDRGDLVTYGRLASSVGSPSAARAVGTAVSHNPLAYLIPCHRVIRETGIVGEYRWGSVRKRAMLAWEGASRGPAA